MLGIRCSAAVRNSGVSFTSGPQTALSTPSLLVQFFNSFTSFLSATLPCGLWCFWKSKESVSEKRRGMFYPPTQSHALVYGCTLPETGTSAQRCSVAVLWAAVATTWEMRFCLYLVLSDSLKTLPDTCVVTTLLAKAQDRKGPKTPAVCFPCLLIMCKHLATRVYLKKGLYFCLLCSLLCVSSSMWIHVCYICWLSFFSSLCGRRGYAFTLLAGWVGKSL